MDKRKSHSISTYLYKDICSNTELRRIFLLGGVGDEYYFDYLLPAASLANISNSSLIFKLSAY